ncbi:hypothetical protein [Streptomyces sp. NPDC050287]|uniref:hypothetical protein n=1 Tax=Streptomyces sp. NPDC050287 TaxID=3365608 RepID=UPI0037A80807
MTFISRKPTLSSSAFLLALMVSGCSSDSTPKADLSPSQQGMRATQLCNDLLDTEGGAALEEITDSQYFTETRGTGDQQVNKLPQAATKLRATASFERRSKKINLCLPNATGESAANNLAISAQWLRTTSKDYSWQSSDDITTFDISGTGDKDVKLPYAYAGKKFAGFDFRCPVGPGSNEATVLAVEILGSLNSMTTNQAEKSPELLTHIAHTVAVKLAKELDCFSESRIPEALGTLKKFPPAG